MSNLAKAAALAGFALMAMPVVQMLLGAMGPRPIDAVVGFLGALLFAFAVAKRRA